MTIRDMRAAATEIKRTCSNWANVRFTLSNSQRYELIRQIEANPCTHKDCEQVLRDLVLDSADNTPEYIEVLRSLIVDYQFERSDRSYLFTLLIWVGTEKQEIAQTIVDRLLPDIPDGTLAVVVGHLLGGLSIGKADALVSRLATEATVADPLTLRALIIAVRIALRDSKAIPKDLIEYLHLCLKRGDVDVNNHILHLALANYGKDKEQLYGLLESLVSEKDQKYGTLLFSEVAHSSLDFSERILDPHHFVHLIGYCKDRDGDVRKVIFQSLRRYPEYAFQIIDLIFFWLDDDFPWYVEGWILEDIARRNPEVINEYIRRYRVWRHRSGNYNEPLFFEHLAIVDLERAVNATIAIGPRDDIDIVVVKRLLASILGCCYSNQTNTAALQIMGRFVYDLCKNRPFSYCIINEDHLNSPILRKEEYGGLIDSIDLTITKIDSLPVSYNFQKIRSILSNYPLIRDLFSPTLEKCEKGLKYHPLLQILESGYDESHQADRTIPKYYLAQLDQLEAGCHTHLAVPSGRWKEDSSKKKNLKNKIKNPDIVQFWNFFSELLLINRFGPDMVSALDQRIVNEKDIDIDVSFNGAQLLIEVISPQRNRESKVSNEARFFRSRVKEGVKEKCHRFDKSGAMDLARKRNDVFLIMGINVDNLPFFEHDSLDALLGPYAIQISKNSENDATSSEMIRDHSSAILEELQFGDQISAVICYKIKYISDSAGRTIIIPDGYIFDNPRAMNRLSSVQLDELAKCIFNKP